MTRRRLLALSTVTLTAALLLTACAGSTGSASVKTLVWGSATAPTSLDIAHGFDETSTIIQGAVLQSVVSLDRNAKVIPSLAQSWKQPDPTTYVFHLRPGVRFSDGTLMSAEDVAYSLQRQLDPQVASQAASYFADVKDVTTRGSDTVVVTMKRPDSAFLAAAATAWQVVPKKLAQAHPKDLGSPQVGTMGTGPYKVTKFSLTAGTVLDLNDHYWGPKPAIPHIEIKTISDSDTLRLAVSSGQVDATIDVPLQDSRRWTNLPDVNLGFIPANIIAFLSLDTATAGPLKDVHVRRAIADAIDKNALIHLQTAGHGSAATALLTQPQLTALYGSNPPQLPTYPLNLTAAKSELAQSNYPHGFALTVPYNGAADAMQIIVSDLAKVGIKITLKPEPDDKYATLYSNHDHLGIQLVTLGYVTPNAGEVLPDLLSQASAKSQGFNTSMYASPALDVELNQMVGATGTERTALTTKILTEVAQQVPYIPLYYQDLPIALNKKFTAPSLSPWTIDWFGAIRPAH